MGIQIDGTRTDAVIQMMWPIKTRVENFLVSQCGSKTGGYGNEEVIKIKEMRDEFKSGEIRTGAPCG